jgi:hypothetical protein
MALSESTCPFPGLISLRLKRDLAPSLMTQSPILKILSSTLTSDEKESVWLAAQARADGVHCTDLTVLVGSMAVPHEDPHWDYQDPSMLATQNYMLTCLIEGLQTASYRAVNFDKLRVIIQCPTENPADFLGHLTEALNRQRMALKPPGRSCENSI